MSNEKEKEVVGASLDNISSSTDKKVSFTPRAYYNTPEIKSTLLEFAAYSKNNLTYTKALVHDNNGWYTYKGTGINQKRKMHQGNSPKAYSKFIQQTERTVYLTLNYFREDYKPFTEFQDHQWHIDGWEKCYGFMLSVDIDIKDPYNVHDAKAKEGLRAATQYTYNKLSGLSNDKCICLFSGNGSYIHLHPRFGYIPTDASKKVRMDAYENLIRAFNNYLFDIETSFYKEYPQYKDYVKLDKINNKNRQIKAPLSIHKTFDYVVYPIPTDSFTPQLINYNDVTTPQVNTVREQLKNFISDEPTDKEGKQLMKTLKSYLDEAKKELKDKNKYKDSKPISPENAYDLDLITLEPLVEVIFDTEEWEEGNIRRITLMASYLAASGWKLPDVIELINNHVLGWVRLPEDLERRIVYGFKMHPPGFDRIYTNYSGFPSVGLNDLLQHLPERPQNYDNPMTYIHRKHHENALKEAMESLKLFQIGDGLYSYVDDKKNTIVRRKISYNANGEPIINNIDVIAARPTDLIIFESPLDGEPTKFECKFVSNKRKKPLKVPAGTTEDILSFLRESGLVTQQRYASDWLNVTLNGYAEHGMAEIKTEIQQPGFYLDDHQNLLVVDYEPEYTREQLLEALQLLTELRETWFKSQGKKFMHVFKWGLISPFIYCMKQRGEGVNWIFLHGKSQAGKTTFGICVLCTWNVNDRLHLLGGSSIDTIARLGGILGQGTFPTVVNEPKGAMRNDSVMEGIKNSIESLVCRGRYYGTRYKQTPALSPCIFTANTFKPEEEAAANRYENLDFTFSERKPANNKREFNDKFKPKSLSEDAPLTKLKAIGGFAATKIIEDDSLLKKDWKKLSEQLLSDAFKHVGLEVPEWVFDLAETETIEDIEEETYVMVLDVLKTEINKAYNVKIQVVDDLGRMQTAKDVTSDDITAKDITMVEKAVHVISTTSISWLTTKKEDDKDFICIQYPFVKLLSERLGLQESMPSLAEMLGWECKPIRTGKKPVKAIVVPSMDFLRAIADEELESKQDTF